MPPSFSQRFVSHSHQQFSDNESQTAWRNLPECARFLLSPDGPEPPPRNAYHDNKQPVILVDLVSGVPLSDPLARKLTDPITQRKPPRLATNPHYGSAAGEIKQPPSSPVADLRARTGQIAEHSGIEIQPQASYV